MVHRSVLKRARQNEKLRQRNRMVKSQVRNLSKKVEHLLEAGDLEMAKESYLQFISQIDRAVKKGIFHLNMAARKKSRLARKINAVLYQERKEE